MKWQVSWESCQRSHLQSETNESGEGVEWQRIIRLDGYGGGVDVWAVGGRFQMTTIVGPRVHTATLRPKITDALYCNSVYSGTWYGYRC